MSGLQGIQGMRGLQGNPGPTGAQGPAGIQGMIGVQGIPGPTGAQGNAGIRGVQGVPGLPGGPTGWTGYTGPTGANGYVGSDGSTGREGVQGPQGVQGMQGVQGNDGPQGVQGIQGVQGNDGPQGVQGIQGVLGNTGPQGVQGLQGIQGDTGPTGTQGIDGFSGGVTLQLSYTTQAVPTEGVVTTFAGSSQGFTNATGTNAQFSSPNDVAVDSSGNVYVADDSNHAIRKITPSGLVSTFAGGSQGSNDGLGTNAQFYQPDGITLDSAGNVYVADRYNNSIRKITPGGLVTTLATGFNNPYSVVVDSAGNVYVADTMNHVIKKVTAAGVVSTFAGSGIGAGSYYGTFADGIGPNASFNYPTGVGIDLSGNVYVADAGNNRVRKITSGGSVSTLASSLSVPFGVAVDSSGNVYVAMFSGKNISKITPLGVVTVVAGSGSGGSANGTGTNASFNTPRKVALNSSGSILYLADDSNHNIRKIALPTGADPNTYVDIPFTGTLLTTFNPALSSSTITIPASTTNAKVASFTLAASSLPLKTSVTGVWSVTLYATVGLSTSPASFYFQVVDGSTTVATGTTTTSVNQSSPMQLYKSNLTIPARTYSSDLTLNIFATTQASSSLTLGFNGSTISYLNTTIPTVGTTGATGPTGSPVSGSLVTLSTYTGTVIRNAVAANNSSITTVWSNALPTAAKGRAGTLGMFFNMYSATQFASNTSFDYGVYIDGSSISYGESNTSRYVQTTTSTYAFSSNGIILGSGGMTPYQPISFPLYIPPQANALTIGIANASVPFSPVQSVALAYLSNISTSSGTSNTANFVPQNTFTTTGQFSYTVPSLCSAGAVTGVFIYLWGSGGNYQHNGGWGNQNGAGGSGGFVSGYYGCSPGTVLSYIVGLGGGSIGLDNLNRVGTLDTGGGSGDAGGFSGVFLSNAVVSNTIGIAGGGGGAAYSTGYGGAGGYPTASSGYKSVGGSGAGVPSTGMGGSQTAGGTGTGNSFISPSSQFFGANGNQCCGGGGWFGGGQGAAGGGGGGGSSYIGNVNGASGGIGMIGATTSNGITFSNASMFPISNALPGGTTSPFYQSGRGHGSGGHGLVVIIPAVGTNPVYMGVNARLLAT